MSDVTMKIVNEARAAMRASANLFSSLMIARIVAEIAEKNPAARQVVICDSSHQFDPENTPVIAVLSDDGLSVDDEWVQALHPAAGEALRALDIVGDQIDDDLALYGAAIVVDLVEDDLTEMQQVRMVLDQAVRLPGAADTTFEYDALHFLSEIDLGVLAPEALLLGTSHEGYYELRALEEGEAPADALRSFAGSKAIVLNLKTGKVVTAGAVLA